jgi:hypothetical protein
MAAIGFIALLVTRLANSDPKPPDNTAGPVVSPGPPPAGAVPFGAGYYVVPAPGWSVDANFRQEPNALVNLTKDNANALWHVDSGPVGARKAGSVVASGVNAIGLTTVKTSQVVMQQPPKSNITSYASVTYTGTIATNQGSRNVEGTVLAIVRVDGEAAFAYSLNFEGQTSIYSSDYNAMLVSILRSA